MKRQVRACAILMAAVMTGCCTERIVPPAAKDRATVVKGAWRPTLPSAWKGKKVAFLGDSITDPAHVGCTANYWNYLPDLLGIDAYVYGKNGWRMDGMLTQAEWLKDELGDEVDAIFVLAGTNDYNGSVPRGEWYEEREETVNRSDGPARLKHRVLSMNTTTFRGRLNRLLGYLKHNFPRQQIVLMTALHRGYATLVRRTSSRTRRSATCAASSSTTSMRTSVKPVVVGVCRSWISSSGADSIPTNRSTCRIFIARIRTCSIRAPQDIAALPRRWPTGC